jgi:hypothetical protein
VSTLATISATFQAIQLAKGAVASAIGPLSIEKLHDLHMRMICCLCSVDTRNEWDLMQFFTKLSSAPGRGGTGAVIRWNLQMTFNNWNIHIMDGCIIAITRGLWRWE